MGLPDDIAMDGNDARHMAHEHYWHALRADVAALAGAFGAFDAERVERALDVTALGVHQPLVVCGTAHGIR